jgi:fermentation-respiration switch protein FrsA (DUF1100 family)
LAIDGAKVFRTTVLLAACLAGIVALMVLFERSLIFFPTSYPDGQWEVGEVVRGSRCTIEDCFYAAEDGTRLHSWWCRPPEPEAAGPVFLFFHGNAGNLSHRADFVLELAARIGAEVVVAGYRGYGRSEGKPSEEGLYADARAAWGLITAERGIDPRRVVIFGRSLGGAVAVNLATETPPAGLIVESTFTSIPDIAARHYPFVPRFLIRTRMESLAKIGQIGCPLLVVHSKADRVVPFDLGRRLFEAAPQPKAFYEVVGAGHNETWLVGGPAYFDAVADLVRSASAGTTIKNP